MKKALLSFKDSLKRRSDVVVRLDKAVIKSCQSLCNSSLLLIVLAVRVWPFCECIDEQIRTIVLFRDRSACGMRFDSILVSPLLGFIHDATCVGYGWAKLAEGNWICTGISLS